MSYLVIIEVAQVLRFVNRMVTCLYNAVDPQMKVFTYYEIVDIARRIDYIGHAKLAAYEVRKKDKMSGSFSSDSSTNRRAENKEK